MKTIKRFIVSCMLGTLIPSLTGPTAWAKNEDHCSANDYEGCIWEGRTATSSKKKISCFSKAARLASSNAEKARAVVLRAYAHIFYKIDFLGETWESSGKGNGFVDPARNDAIMEESVVPVGRRKKDGYEDCRKALQLCDKVSSDNPGVLMKVDTYRADAYFGIAMYWFWKGYTFLMIPEDEDDLKKGRKYLDKSLDTISDCLKRDKWCSSAYELRSWVYALLGEESSSIRNEKIRDHLRTFDDPEGSGNGLAAYYFDNITFDGTRGVLDVDSLKFLRKSDTVNYNWGENAPVAGIGEDTFGVLWKGRLKIPEDGDYRFQVESDDGIKLFLNLNPVPVVEDWNLHGARKKQSEAVRLQKDTLVPLSLEFYEKGGSAVARLYWKKPSSSRYVIIPKKHLYLPSEPPFARFPQFFDHDVEGDRVRYWQVELDAGTYSLKGNFKRDISFCTVPACYKAVVRGGSHRKAVEGPDPGSDELVEEKNFRKGSLDQSISWVKIETAPDFGK